LCAAYGKRPPNPALKLLECWREVWPRLINVTGHKSMGGRMASLLAMS